MSTLREARRILAGQPQARATVAYQGSSSLTSAAFGGLTITSQGVALQLDSDERSWTALAAAYRCVALISTNLAAVNMAVLDGDEVDDADPVARLWNEGAPGAAYSAPVVKQIAYARAELRGESFTYLDRGGIPTAPVRQAVPVFDPVVVHVAMVDTGGPLPVPSVIGYTVKTVNGDVPLLPAEMLWLRYPDPLTPWGAIAPWKAALYAAESDAYARAWQRNMLRNDARPAMIVNAGSMSAEQFTRLQAEWNAKIAGPGNGGRSFLTSSPTPVDAKPLTFTPAEMSYLESRKANADEVMLAFGVRRDVLFGESTYENQRAAKTALWTDTLLGKLDTFAGEVDRQLVPEPGRTVVWDLSEVEALRESQDAVINRLSNAVYPDILTIDEARAELGLEPLPGGIGTYTLTAYRERMRLGAQAEFLPLLGATPGRAHAGTVLIRAAGATVRKRVKVDPAAARAARAADNIGPTLAAYDRHESIGVRAIRRLAARQEKAVMRELNKLRSDRHAPAMLERMAPALRNPAPQRALVVMGHTTTVREAVVPDGTRAAADDLFDVDYWTRETTAALEDFMAGTWAEGGEVAARSFGVSWDTFEPSVEGAMEVRLDTLASELSTTTRNVLESQLIDAAVQEGASIDDLADRIHTTFTDLSTWRAQAIARTEVVGGFNGAAHTVAAESGVVATRQWLATSDTRTRASHRAINGHVLAKLDERYPNGCLFPGDPSAPPGETVNCRCVELFDVAD